MSDAPLLRPAGLLRRAAAMLYDGMIVLAIWLATLMIWVGVHGTAVLGPTVRSVLFVELFGFFAYFWVRRGQTVGMLAWGLHLETRDGGRIRPYHALLRFVGAGLSFATLGVGYLWMYVDPDRRTWADMLSATHVVYRPRR